MKDRIISTVSHELRGPLTSILGWVELLKGRPLTDSLAQDGIVAIEKSAHEISRVLEVLASYQASNVSGNGDGREYLNLVDTVDNVISRMNAATPRHEVGIRVAIEEPDAILLGDSAQLDDALYTLVKHATGSSTAPLELTIGRSEDKVTVQLTSPQPNPERGEQGRGHHPLIDAKPSTVDRLEIEMALLVVNLHEGTVDFRDNGFLMALPSSALPAHSG